MTTTKTPTTTRAPTPSFSSATASHTQRSFQIRTRKLPISRAGPIDEMAARLSLPSIPEMIFGDNLVEITHPPTGWSLRFTAEEALDRVDKTGERGMLQVAYAREWSRSRNFGGTTNGDGAFGVVRGVVKPFDWSFSTDYRGSETPGKSSDGEQRTLTSPGVPATAEEAARMEKVHGIPLELLKRRDPILFFDDVMLYESELDDNGISVLSAKLRVMERRMLLLARHFLRVDGVLVRVRDTRVYIDFETSRVVREYTAREDKFENARSNLIMTGLKPDAVTMALRDANQVARLLPIVDESLESVSLAPTTMEGMTS